MLIQKNHNFARKKISYEEVFRRGIFIDEIRIEDIELVALYDFRRWIIHVVMRLIVFVPFETGMHAIEVTRLTRPILIGP